MTPLTSETFCVFPAVDSAQFERLFKDVRNHSDSDTISKDLFRQVMKENGTSIFDDEQILDSFWGALDANKDNSVNQKELIVGLTVLANGSAEEKLKLSFNIYDLDRSGSISVSEFKTMMRAMGRLRLYSDKQLDTWVDTTVSDLFKKLDKDGNGELTRDGTVEGGYNPPWTCFSIKSYHFLVELFGFLLN
jgi:guanylate cyclase activator 1